MTEVLKVQRKAADILQQQVLSCELIPSGLTNSSYRIATGKGAYVYRVPAPGAAVLVNRSHEREAIEKIAALELDAPTVFFDAGTGEKITVLVADSSFTQMPAAGRLPVICRLLRKLHYSAIVFNNTFSLIDKLNFHEEVMKMNRIPFPSGYKSVRNCVDILCEDLAVLLRGQPLAACHNDVVPENILMDGSGNAFLIDWEYAGMNDPAWDLAAYSLESSLGREEEEEMLRLYFNGVYEGTIRYRMWIHKIGQDVLWCLWARIKSHFGAGLLTYADFRYQRALNHLSNGK
jgi:thiamine kinase-like enzyme